MKLKLLITLTILICVHSKPDFLFILTSKGVSKILNFYSNTLKEKLAKFEIPNIEGTILAGSVSYNASGFRIDSLKFDPPKFTVNEKEKIKYQFKLSEFIFRFDFQVKRDSFPSIHKEITGKIKVIGLELKSSIEIDSDSPIIQFIQKNIETTFDDINFEIEDSTYVNWVIWALKPFINQQLILLMNSQRKQGVQLLNEAIYKTGGMILIDPEYQKFANLHALGFKLDSDVQYLKNQILIPLKMSLIKELPKISD
jgi:hypothetical protein